MIMEPPYCFVHLTTNEYSNMREELKALREVEGAARNEAIFWNEDLCVGKESDERLDAIEKLQLAIKRVDSVRKANEQKA